MTEPEAVPVLTQIVDEERAPPAVDGAALEALARHLERAVLERLAAETDRIAARAIDGMRGELRVAVTQTVREALAASLAHALAHPRRD
ncbi:MAG TPA: hypothetical protein VM489_15130 [Burkholderiales bacterium]|nr:hypothetical protein [Burkholderiales bacterium]